MKKLKVSKKGYKQNSPDKDEEMLLIPSGNITMKGVNHPVLGVDNFGNQQFMMPGYDYEFPGSQVTEIPIRQMGGIQIGNNLQQSDQAIYNDPMKKYLYQFDLLNALIGKGGKVDLKSDEVKALLNEEKGMDLINAAVVFNQRPELANMNPTQRVSTFYSLQSDNPFIEQFKTKGKSIGYGIQNAYSSSPMAEIKKQIGQRQTGGNVKPVDLIGTPSVANSFLGTKYLTKDNKIPGFEEVKNQKNYTPYAGFLSVGMNLFANYLKNKELLDYNRQQVFLENQPSVAIPTTMGQYGNPYVYEDGGIHIKKSKKGTFTKAAKEHGMGVQEFARKVLANKDNYSPAMVKKANFAKNASKWKHEEGGNFQIGGLYAPEDLSYLPSSLADVNYMPTPQSSEASVATSEAIKEVKSSNISDLKSYIKHRESRGRYNAYTSAGGGEGAAGAYQFRWKLHKGWISKVTGINNVKEFLNNPEAQDAAFDYWDQTTLTPWANRIKKQTKTNQSLDQIKAKIHFAGPQGALDYFMTGKETKDAFGTSTSTYQTGGQIADIKSFYNTYLESPNYKERLKKQGYENPQQVINDRKNRLNSVKISNNTGLGNINNYNTNSINFDKNEQQKYNLDPLTTAAHELSHVAGSRGVSSGSLYGNNSLNINEISLINSFNKSKDPHDQMAQEAKADIDSFRYLLKKSKIYDTGTEKFTPELLKKAKSVFSNNTTISRLFKNFDDKDLIYLMNNIAMSNNINQDKFYAKNGGEYKENLEYEMTHEEALNLIKQGYEIELI